MLDKRSIPVILPSVNSSKWQQGSSDKVQSGNAKVVQKDRIVDGKQRLPVFVPKPLHYKTKKM